MDESNPPRPSEPQTVFQPMHPVKVQQSADNAAYDTLKYGPIPQGHDKTDWRLAAFSAAGVDLKQLECKLPGIVARINRQPESIGANEYLRLLEEAEKLTNAPDLGLRLARHSDFRSMGIYGDLVLSAENIEEIFRCAVHYHPILYRRAQYFFTVGVETAIFSLKSTYASRIDNEWTLGAFVYLVRALTRSDWVPVRVSFTNSAPENATALRHTFGDSILFDQPSNFFEIELALLQQPVSQGNPALSGTIRREADRLLASYAKTDSLEYQVRLLILKNMGTGDNSSSRAARELGISRSTLKRRLAAIDNSFRKLHDDVVNDLAKQALAETRTPITEIALRLGYSELSAFDRTFLRLAEMTPGQYREKAARRTLKN